MSDDLSPPEPAVSRSDPQAEARAVEAAAIRRRWITLGEALAVVAVVISGLTLWNSWTERSESEAAKHAETQQASRRGATLVLTASAVNDHKLALKPTAGEQSVQSQRLVFPSALGTAAVETTGEPRIEAAWFERAREGAEPGRAARRQPRRRTAAGRHHHAFPGRRRRARGCRGLRHRLHRLGPSAQRSQRHAAGALAGQPRQERRCAGPARSAVEEAVSAEIAS